MVTRSRATAGAVVAVIALVAGVAGYVLAPDDGNPGDSEGDALAAGALVTATATGWTEAGLAYEVVVIAERGIESIRLMAGELELDRVEPDDRSVVRVTMHAMSAEPARAVVTLSDGRQVSSRTITSVGGRRLAEAGGGDEGPTGQRADGAVPVPIALRASDPVMAPGEAPSALVQANRPGLSPVAGRAGVEAESGVTWSGPGELRDGFLEIHDPGVRRVFFYVTDDGDRWHRVPDAAGTSLPLANGRVEVAGLLPVLEGTDLQLEIWRDDSDTALLGIATASSQTPWEQASYNGELGFLGRLDLDLVVGAGDEEELVKALWLDQAAWSPIDLKWGSDLPNVTHIVWQAHTFRPPDGASPTDLSAASTGWAKPDNEGRFTFVPPGVVSESGTTVESAETGQSFLDYQLVRGQGEPGSADNALPQDLKLQLAGIEVAPETPRSWYLRGFAFSGDQWIGVASDVVSVHLGRAPSLKQAPPEGGYNIELDVSAPVPVDPSFRFCWVVVEVNEWAKIEHLANAAANDPDEWFRASVEYAYLDAIRAKYGDTLCQNLCYRDLDVDWPEGSVENWIDDWSGGGLQAAFPPGCDSSGSSCSDTLGAVAGGLCDAVIMGGVSLGTLVVDGYTVLKKTYDEIKAEVIDFATQYSGCDALLDEELCDTAAKIALDAALASVGVPPSLPSTEQIVNSAKGDLKATLVELANEHVGSVCDAGAIGNQFSEDIPTCEQLADDLVEEAVAMAKQLARRDARNSFGMPFPPGVEVKPHPLGNALPLHVRVEVTAEPGTTPGPTCEINLVASVASTPHPTGLPGNAFFDVSWPPLSFGAGGESWFVADETFMDWYDGESVQFPKPSTDAETVALDVLLDPPSGPSGRYAWGSTAFSEWAVWEVPRDVLVLRPGARVTVVASAACANGDIATSMVALSG